MKSSSSQRSGDADGDGLLPDAGKPFRQLALPEQAEHFLFDQARQQQRAIERVDIGCGNHAARRLSYTHAVKSILTAAAMVIGMSMPVLRPARGADRGDAGCAYGRTRDP